MKEFQFERAPSIGSSHFDILARDKTTF